MWPLKVKGGRH